MKAVQTFTVMSELPPELEPLRAVAMNLGWADDPRAQDLFRRLDPEGVEFESRDPAQILATESRERLEQLAADSHFTGLAAAVALFASYGETIFQQLGIADQIKAKAVSPDLGVRVGTLVARGEAEIGVQQFNELLPIAEAACTSIFVENMPFAFLPGVQELLNALDSYGDGSIGVVYDVANSHFVKEDVASALRAWATVPHMLMTTTPACLS